MQGSVHVAVTEQGLQGENGHASIEQHGRTGVTELVGRDMDIHLTAKRLQTRLAVAAAQGFVMAGEEIVTCFISMGEIGLNDFHGWRAEKYHALALVLGLSNVNGSLR